MNKEKAIGILKRPPFYPNTPSDKDFASALKLGAEALEVLRRGELLPSETSETKDF